MTGYVLDLGTGLGHVAAQLAERVGPTGAPPAVVGAWGRA
jgi:ubiquinone/menaquinone biosynthesis C-methylase UbiE